MEQLPEVAEVHLVVAVAGERDELVDQRDQALGVLADDREERLPELRILVPLGEQLEECVDRDERVLDLVRQPEQDPVEEIERLARLALPVELVPGPRVVQEHDGAARGTRGVEDPRRADLERGLLAGQLHLDQPELAPAPHRLVSRSPSGEGRTRRSCPSTSPTGSSRICSARRLNRVTRPGGVDRDGAALEVGQDLLDEAVLGADGVEERDVLDGHGDLAGQREEPLQILRAVGLSGDARAEHQDADQLGLDPERHGDLASQERELPGGLDPVRLAIQLVPHGQAHVLPEPLGEPLAALQAEPLGQIGIEPSVAPRPVPALVVGQKERHAPRPDELGDRVQEELDDPLDVEVGGEELAQLLQHRSERCRAAAVPVRRGRGGDRLPPRPVSPERGDLAARAAACGAPARPRAGARRPECPGRSRDRTGRPPGAPGRQGGSRPTRKGRAAVLAAAASSSGSTSAEAKSRSSTSACPAAPGSRAWASVVSGPETPGCR